MALTTTEFTKRFPRDITIETDLGVGATPSTNLRDGACTLHSMTFDNRAAGHAYGSVKLYDSDGDGLVPGTTDPVLVIPIADNAIVEVDIDDGMDFESGLSIVSAVEDGDVTTTGPPGDISGYLITS